MTLLVNILIRFRPFGLAIVFVGAATAAHAQSFVPSNAQLAELLAEEEFAELERLAERIREEQPRSLDGLWESDRFYAVLSASYEGNEEEFADRIADWERAFPESIAWRIVVVRAYYNLVVPQGRYLQRGYLGRQSRRILSQAWRIIEDARELEQDDVALYPTALRIGRWVNARRARSVDEGPLIVGRNAGTIGGNESPAETQRMLERLLAESDSIQPGYGPSYEAMAVTLLPQSGAPEGAAERFAQEARSAHGDEMYARVALALLTATGLNAYSDTFRLSWDHIKSGFESILEEYPRSLMFKNYFCFMACLYMDRDTARRLFDELGDDWEQRLWGGYYERWRGWANNEAAHPLTR